MFERFMESNFVWGFRDIVSQAKHWARLITLPSGILQSGEECLQVRQATHDFFNTLTYTVSFECDYTIWFEKYV